MTERICRDKRCTTKLVSYNPGPFCFMHTPLTPVTGRGFAEGKPKRIRMAELTRDERDKLVELTKEERQRYADGDWLR